MYIAGVVLTFAATIVAFEENQFEREIVFKLIFGEACTTQGGKKGVCIEPDLCENNYAVGRGLTSHISISSTCSKKTEICCDRSNLKTSNSAATETQKKACGYRNPNGVGPRISTSNDNAKFGEFPWTVAIYRKEVIREYGRDILKDVYIGGGSIIHQSVVLTGGKVVEDKEDLFIRAGEWDVQSKDEAYPSQDRDVEDVVIHDKYNPHNLFNNIALVFLEKPLELAPNVGVLCLPQYNRRPEGGAKCILSGWGKSKFGKRNQYRSIMKKLELPVVENTRCQSALRSTRLGRYFQLHSSFICAGGEKDKDSCEGDGGSPLFCPVEHEKDRYVQNGITAWGINCGQAGIPGVYTDVAALRLWVDQYIEERGYDPAVYTY